MTVLLPSDPTDSRAMSRELGQILSERLDLTRQLAQKLPAEVTLLRAGEVVSRLPFLLSGRVDAVMHLQGGNGGRVVPVSFGAGEFVLLSQLFCSLPSPIDLIAARPLELRWAQIKDIEQALLNNYLLLVLVVRFLAQRLREAQTRERGWMERGVHERVCATLTRLALMSPRDADGCVTIVATHEELAARSGVSRPKLSQALKRLEQAGRLRLERGSIRIIGMDDLCNPDQ